MLHINILILKKQSGSRLLCPTSSRGQVSTYYSLRSKLWVRSNTLQLGEDLGEEAGLRIDPQHCATEIAILSFYFLNYTARKTKVALFPSLSTFNYGKSTWACWWWWHIGPKTFPCQSPQGKVSRGSWNEIENNVNCHYLMARHYASKQTHHWLLWEEVTWSRCPCSCRRGRGRRARWPAARSPAPRCCPRSHEPGTYIFTLHLKQHFRPSL